MLLSCQACLFKRSVLRGNARRFDDHDFLNALRAFLLDEGRIVERTVAAAVVHQPDAEISMTALHNDAAVDAHPLEYTGKEQAQLDAVGKLRGQHLVG